LKRIWANHQQIKRCEEHHAACLLKIVKKFFQVGSNEVLLDDSQRIHDKIQKAKGISELEIYEDVPHCWQMFDSMMPEAWTALQKAVEFIDKYLSQN
jgi:acetyl esterase/lipase